MADDTTLIRATWRFRTPAPDERAGGQAEFAAVDRRAGRPVLLPVRSVYWRRAGVAQTFRREQSYGLWSTAARDELAADRVAEPSAPVVKPTVIWRSSADTARALPRGAPERY